MIEVLHTDAGSPKKNGAGQYWLFGLAAFVIAGVLGVVATLSNKDGTLAIEAYTLMMHMEENGSASKEEKNKAIRFLGKNQDLMREAARYFLDDASVVEQVTKRASTPFSQSTRLIAQKKYKEALEQSLKNQELLTTIPLKCLNLLRILALESLLDIDDHRKTLSRLQELKEQHPIETQEILSVFKIGSISVDTLYS
jgi:hypothetical protein